MSDLQFTSVDRILGSIHADLRGSNLNETDAIEWIGEALEFMGMPEIQEQSVAFLKVENYEASVPEGFQTVLQMAKYFPDKKVKKKETIDTPKPNIKIEECPDNIDNLVSALMGTLDTSYRPYFDMQWQYIPWTTSAYFIERFRPIRLANHSLFNSIVCKEKKLYQNYCGDEEYTIVGTTEKKFRFSFKKGYVALSYNKSAIDSETGYPLVPDNIRHISAIKYYIKWKLAERNIWNGREGAGNLAKYNMDLWLKYVKQAKNWSKIPKTLDQHQNMLEETHHLIPRLGRYYGYFGNLGRAERRKTRL